MLSASAGFSVGGSSFLEHPRDPDEEDGTDDRDNDGADKASRVNAEQAQQPAANYGPDDAEDNIHNRAVTAAFHDLAGSPTCDQADDYPPNQICDHLECSF